MAQVDDDVPMIGRKPYQKVLCVRGDEGGDDYRFVYLETTTEKMCYKSGALKKVMWNKMESQCMAYEPGKNLLHMSDYCWAEEKRKKDAVNKRKSDKKEDPKESKKAFTIPDGMQNDTHAGTTSASSNTPVAAGRKPKPVGALRAKSPLKVDEPSEHESEPQTSKLPPVQTKLKPLVIPKTESAPATFKPEKPTTTTKIATVEEEEEEEEEEEDEMNYVESSDSDLSDMLQDSEDEIMEYEKEYYIDEEEAFGARKRKRGNGSREVGGKRRRRAESDSDDESEATATRVRTGAEQTVSSGGRGVQMTPFAQININVSDVALMFLANLFKK